MGLTGMTTYNQHDLPLPEIGDTEDSDPLGTEEQMVVDQALSILEKRHRRGALLTSPGTTQDFLKLRLSGERNEVFGCIFLTNRHTVIAVEELFYGTIDGATVHSRVVVQNALMQNAAALLLYHNYPSGDPLPSAADKRLADRLCEALTRMVDHGASRECLHADNSRGKVRFLRRWENCDPTEGHLVTLIYRSIPTCPTRASRLRHSADTTSDMKKPPLGGLLNLQKYILNIAPRDVLDLTS